MNAIRADITTLNVDAIVNASPEDRRAGCLLGLATGDALGTTLEFTRPGSFKPMTDMVGDGPFHLEAGQWTDDTSMALCLAASLIECGFDLRDQIERYVRWWKEGYFSSTGSCFDIGNTVSAALRAFMRTGEPVSGSTDPYAAGNGSIMRLAPVPLFFHNADDCIHFSGESSRTTHQAPTAIDACKYLGGILWGLLHGASKADVLAPMYHPSGLAWTYLDPAISEIAMGSFKVKEPPEIRGSGYVVASLEAALWAFHKSESFEEGALLAVNLGEDADTTGAVFGQIAGAFYGKSGIPGRWLEKLHDKELMEKMVQQLIGPDKTNP
jgi:ADP-ribosylglycohydrolase